MKIQQFLEHHGIVRNPFSDEDAQTDPVFTESCIDSTYHPAWDKVYGDPAVPSTAIVFGEKGSGKTAMRLQIARHLEQHNARNPDDRIFVVHYDDFNPFLDRFRGRSKKRADRVLAQWRLWHHMDGILSLATTGLVDKILDVHRAGTPVDAVINASDVDGMDRHQARDLLLMAACYDQSTAETFRGRWHRLRKRLRFHTWKAAIPFAIGVVGSIAAIAGVGALLYYGQMVMGSSNWAILLGVLLLVVWFPWLAKFTHRFLKARRILRHMRVGNHELNPLRQVLMHFTNAELSGQPLPDKESTDDRYEFLVKLQGLLSTLNHKGIVVLVDRLDEPHMINGSAELMKAFLWPMLDNKFLKYPGLGLKLMLPIELTRFVEREEREFYQRARLDKQNMVRSFEWTGEALYDVTNARLAACSEPSATPTLDELLEDGITHQRLIDALRSLRVPRHLSKFMYRLLVAHCNAHTDQQPVWLISPNTFESTLALYLRDQDAFDRGIGAG